MKKLSLLLCVIFVLLSQANVFAQSEILSAVELSVSQKSIVLDNKGESKFIDVFVKQKDGSIYDAKKDAIYESTNPDVAIAYEGRILAMGKGEAVITITYNDVKQRLNVKVLSEKDYEKTVLETFKKKTSSNILSLTSLFSVASLTDNERYNMMQKGSSMINVKWTPTKNLTGWKGHIYYKGKQVTGIPYSQTVYQRDDITFKSSLSNSDFYNSYTCQVYNSTTKKYDTVSTPKYGNDCSGFVSFCWGISRSNTTDFINRIKSGTYPKVGSYNAASPSTADLKNSYAKMKQGDAVVNSGHTFLIGLNSSATQVICYEQTPYNAVCSVWTYDSLANGKYMPFSKQ
jgi:hypothetical protein